MKKIKFPLEMADHTKVTNLDDLRAHFDLESVMEYYKSGKLQTWLEDRYFEEEAEAVSVLDETASDFQAQLCKIFGVEYSGQSVNLEEIARRQARLEKLRSLTDEAEYLEQIDRVAFDQDELADLLDEKEKTIYLCGKKFMIPVSQKGVSYIGINAPSAHLSGKVPQSAGELGICFTNVNVDNLPEEIISTSGCLTETNRISDDNFTDMTDLLMGWNWDKIIETRNYLYSHNYPHSLLINKATGEKTLLSGKHLPSDNDGRCVYGDCIFYESDDHIWSFDFSTCDSPRKLSDIETRKFSICGSYLAFLKTSRYNESSIYLYNIDEEKLSKIADVLNCRGIIASKNGIYYITELPRVGVREEYVGSIACLYKYDTKTTTILFKLPREPYANDILAVPNDHTMYIDSWNHIYSVDFSGISADDVAKVSRNLLTDYWDTPMAHFQGGGKVDPFENGVIYVAEEGVLKVFSYLTGETMALATGAKEHHSIDGGLFRKSSSWDVPVAFYQIGDWIYYKVGGTDKARVSMKQPGETVIVKDLDFDVRQDIREKTPKVSVD